ncbi:hypothetical protein L1987_18943 [Smallanthus sonchifolius]|uniref:Uncharacterized protein n=1 Tax=Smallanthus sonchifolius TaxID=185202 RepID=A0ACB9J341_9ASTR|nr:hypothetical protein L1987_18943 [Smallanthus sonchifolius]
MEKELSRKTIVELLRQDELEAKAQADEAKAKNAVVSLSSILSTELEKRKSLNVPSKVARVYLRRKLPKDVTSEPPLVVISEDSNQDERYKEISDDASPKVQKTFDEVPKEATPKVTPDVVHKSDIP